MDVLEDLTRVHAALTHELQAAGAVAPPIEVASVPELHRDRSNGARFRLIQTTATVTR
jgi:hypothetical protein